MDDMEAAELLRSHGIPVARQLLARTESEAVAAAKKTGYPLVLKISSPDIIHKTDLGAIKVGVEDVFELRKEFKRIMRNAKRHSKHADIRGVIVQEMVSGPQLREVIVGGKRDPQFGPVLMFGLGGIFVEVMKDVSFGIVPVQRHDIKRMVSGIKGYKVLKGARGQRPINFRALEGCLLSISRMMWKLEKKKSTRIRELDINPLFVDDKRCIAADIRIFV